MIETACRHAKPVRIGVNWGSLDQDLLTRMMDDTRSCPSRAMRSRCCARRRSLGARLRARREELGSRTTRS